MSQDDVHLLIASRQKSLSREPTKYIDKTRFRDRRSKAREPFGPRYAYRVQNDVLAAVITSDFHARRVGTSLT